MKIKTIFIFLAAIFVCCGQAAAQDDSLLDILRSELNTQYSELQKQELPPYQMSYRVIDRSEWSVTSSFGALMSKRHERMRSMIPQIRVGSYEFDNFKRFYVGNDRNSVALLPVDDENNADAIRQAIWKETTDRYNFALRMYNEGRTQKTVSVESDDKSPCYSEAAVEQYYEAPISDVAFDLNLWGARMNEISAVFNSNDYIMEGMAAIDYLVERRYFLDTDGREIAQNLPYVRITVSGQIKADDGMELPLNLSYFAYDPRNLPSQNEILEDTEKLLAKLLELREAPIVDPFTGPALLSGTASGVFFHEIFGHRIEGSRMKNDADGQTFKNMVGQPVLPASMNVFDDPTLNTYNSEDLNGYYKFDDEGVRARRVQAVEGGMLKDFLMTRTPLDGHPQSNGHARGEQGFDPVSRQSNLIIETTDPKSETELRSLLIEEAKKQGKDCGYYFKEVTGGLTYAGKESISSFNVTPLEVYKIYVDGRPDELVRGVDLIGTPLSMFSNIVYAGGESQVFTGICGAESGDIPVTAISPMVLVSKVELQRKPKSQDTAPILPRPDMNK